MASYLYKPECPHSDASGMIEKGLYYQWLSLSAEPKWMTIGNQPVVLHYIADEMAPTRHMCSNKLYTSKKKFRNETKAYNCVEVGNEASTILKPRKPIKLDRKKRREDFKRAIWELRNGEAPRIPKK